jgi:aldehyde dehydrogenase (NAD+)
LRAVGAEILLQANSAEEPVNIHLFIETMPFGGVGYSGIGHYYGNAGFNALSHAKSVLISPRDVAIEHLFPPYTEEKVKALSQWFEY